jgi:hypothetical protein
MPVDTRINIPFNPQEGITSQILSAIQLANEQHRSQQQTNIQQQQVNQQGALIPSDIAQKQAATALDRAQTDTAEFNLKSRKEMFQTLTGTSLDAPPGTAPAPTGGLISDTVNNLIQDPSLSGTEKQALGVAGRQAMLRAYQDPATAMDGVVSTYNDILKQHGDNTRAIKTETIPDGKSNTGYSVVGTRPDGSEAYRIQAPLPTPKTLDEATSYLGSASLAYQRDPTPGNKAALDQFTKQHDAMYADHLAEVEKQARATAQTHGADVEAMYRIGQNPVTGETLNLGNAPPSALVNPGTGEVIPQSMIGLYKPTMNERQTADTARQVLAISQDLKDEVAKNPNLIGPLAGRSKEGLQKLGLNAADSSKLLDDLSFLQSAATKMHTGRFSAEIMQKMGNLIKPGMNADEFKGGLESINDVATRYANEDKLTTVYEYQQRQQYENQGSQSPAPAQPATNQGGGDFFKQFGGVKH